MKRLRAKTSDIMAFLDKKGYHGCPNDALSGYLGSRLTALGGELFTNIDFEDVTGNGGTTTNVATVSRARSGNVATIIATGHGLASTNVVDIVSMGGTGYNATGVTVTVSDVNTFTYANTGSDEGTTADTNGRVRTNIFPGWSFTFDTTGWAVRATAIKHAGTYALAMKTLNAGDAVRAYQSPVIFKRGNLYRVTVWSKVDIVSASHYLKITDGTNLLGQQLLDVNYTQYSFDICPQQNSLGGIYFESSGVENQGKTVYIDDISIKEIINQGTISDRLSGVSYSEVGTLGDKILGHLKTQLGVAASDSRDAARQFFNTNNDL
jgi:hypothetical protein